MQLYEAQRQRGDSHAVARDRVLTTHPFENFPELIEILESLSQRKDGKR